MSRETVNSVVTKQVQFISVNSFLFPAISTIVVDYNIVTPSFTADAFITGVLRKTF